MNQTSFQIPSSTCILWFCGKDKRRRENSSLVEIQRQQLRVPFTLLLCKLSLASFFSPLFLVEATKGYLISILGYSCCVCGFIQKDSSTFFFKSLSPVTEVIRGSVLMTIGQKCVHKIAIYERRSCKGSTGMCLGNVS